jgi:hypothetical protein
MLPATCPLGTALPTGAPAGSRADHPTARPTSPACGKRKLRIADDAARRPATRQGRLPGGGWLRNDGGPRRSRELQHCARDDADMSASPLCSPGTPPGRTCQPAHVREVPRASRQQPCCCRIWPPMPECHFRPQSSHGRNYRARRAKRYYGRTGSERPQTDIGPKSRRYPWHAPHPAATCRRWVMSKATCVLLVSRDSVRPADQDAKLEAVSGCPLRLPCSAPSR